MSKLRQSARGRDCQVRIPGTCKNDTSTTVLAHLNGGGMGRKRKDIHAAFCCGACHDVVDGRAKALDIWGEPIQPIEILLWRHEGVLRTQEIWLEEGLIDIK